MKAPITTHILDLDQGKPAAGVSVRLFAQHNSAEMASASTDEDGRVLQWNTHFQLTEGTYRLAFNVGDWFATRGRECFFPEVSIAFFVKDIHQHYHIPLLLNAHGYSTYRGS